MSKSPRNTILYCTFSWAGYLSVVSSSPLHSVPFFLDARFLLFRASSPTGGDKLKNATTRVSELVKRIYSYSTQTFFYLRDSSLGSTGVSFSIRPTGVRPCSEPIQNTFILSSNTACLPSLRRAEDKEYLKDPLIQAEAAAAHGDGSDSVEVHLPPFASSWLSRARIGTIDQPLLVYCFFFFCFFRTKIMQSRLLLSDLFILCGMLRYASSLSWGKFRASLVQNP